MENATKALLIAAAVLVAILIISLGLVVYNKASESVNSAGNLTEYQIQAFNEKFLKYEGSEVIGTEINAMIKTVLNHNLAQEDNSTCVAVKFRRRFYELGGSSPGRWSEDTTVLTGENVVTTSPENINKIEKYEVKCEISETTKLVKTIYILPDEVGV